MDWFSWLSKTGLDPTLSYEYGLIFARNKLQIEDLPYFDHEFLQSMGITVAKHRLEILKLARKEASGACANNNNKLLRLFSAISKTKKSLTRRIGKWVFQGDSAVVKPLKDEASSPGWKIEPWRGGALVARNYKSDNEFAVDRLPVIKTRRIAKSGPLDGRATMQESLMMANRSLKMSGPLDQSVQERLVLAYRSPVVSGPLDGTGHERLRLSGQLSVRTPSPSVYMGYNKRERPGGDGAAEDKTLWAALFQDMKPT